MRLESRKYLYDIEEAAALAAQFTSGKSFTEYQRDPMLRLAVERAFAIIGEALAQLARIDPITAERITDFRSIIASATFLCMPTRRWTTESYGTSWSRSSRPLHLKSHHSCGRKPES